MTYYPPISPYSAGLSAKCPRCGQGPLFRGFLKLHTACSACQLDYAKADAGDGPAVFVIFIVGFIAVGLAFVARFVWYAPMGVALLVSAVFTIVACLALLRPLKALMIALQFSNKAKEGQVGE